MDIHFFTFQTTTLSYMIGTKYKKENRNLNATVYANFRSF